VDHSVILFDTNSWGGSGGPKKLSIHSSCGGASSGSNDRRRQPLPSNHSGCSGLMITISPPLPVTRSSSCSTVVSGPTDPQAVVS
jgi:hypothetical protein